MSGSNFMNEQSHADSTCGGHGNTGCSLRQTPPNHTIGLLQQRNSSFTKTKQKTNSTWLVDNIYKTQER